MLHRLPTQLIALHFGIFLLYGLVCLFVCSAFPPNLLHHTLAFTLNLLHRTLAFTLIKKRERNCSGGAENYQYICHSVCGSSKQQKLIFKKCRVFVSSDTVFQQPSPKQFKNFDIKRKVLVSTNLLLNNSHL